MFTLELVTLRAEMERRLAPVTPERRSEIMRKIGRRDTPPEMKVRRLLHGLGFRFRLHQRNLPGKPDIVLRKWKTVIFVNGCFWHGCSRCYRGHRVPKTNREFWGKKVANNRSRDRRCCNALRSLGWRTITIWECDTRDEEKMRKALSVLISQRANRVH